MSPRVETLSLNPLLPPKANPCIISLNSLSRRHSLNSLSPRRHPSRVRLASSLSLFAPTLSHPFSLASSLSNVVRSLSFACA